MGRVRRELRKCLISPINQLNVWKTRENGRGTTRRVERESLAACLRSVLRGVRGSSPSGLPVSVSVPGMFLPSLWLLLPLSSGPVLLCSAQGQSWTWEGKVGCWEDEGGSQGGGVT